jgi:hypothetical protein
VVHGRALHRATRRRVRARGRPERDVSLADGDLSLDRDAIVVTPDTADEATRRYRWDPERHRHVYVRDTPEDSPPPPAAKT